MPAQIGPSATPMSIARATKARLPLLWTRCTTSRCPRSSQPPRPRRRGDARVGSIRPARYRAGRRAISLIWTPVRMSARDCRLLATQVHFYSDDVAVVFGSETAVESKPRGVEERRCLYWTDTWLRRAGRWRIAAVQDAQLPCPKGV